MPAPVLGLETEGAGLGRDATRAPGCRATAVLCSAMRPETGPVRGFRFPLHLDPHEHQAVAHLVHQ